MPFVVAEPCINCKYTDCVEVCPVDCFYEGPNFLVIHPDECIDCDACVPVRVVAKEFKATRSMRRVLRINADVVGDPEPRGDTGEARPHANEEQYLLFARYQRARHADGAMNGTDFDDYRAMVEESPVAPTLT